MAFIGLFIGLLLPAIAYSGLLISPQDLIDNCQSFETGDDLSYNWVLPRLDNDVKFIKFEVRAEHGALIGLSRQNMVLDSMYEIEIGADFNSRTIFRRCHQCDSIATENKPGRLSGTDARMFWILFYQGVLAIGSDNSLEPFLVWIDRYPLEVNHVGFTTDGVGGWWKFSKFPGTFTSTTSGDACVLYPFLKLPNGNFEISFSVKWTGTTALELAEEQKSDHCYYIVLNHIDNTNDISAEIRINDQTAVSATYTPWQAMISDDPAYFYVRMENSNLQLGEKYMDPFLELPGVNTTFLQHLGFSSFISDSADWYFPDMIPDVVGYTDTLSDAEDCLCYRDVQVFYTDGVTLSLFAIHGYSVGEYELQFKLKAEGRARIILTDSPMGSIDGYNIVFDDGHTTDEFQTSYISLNQEVLQSIHEDILSSSTNRPFYIRYAQETLSVGPEGSTPMLSVGNVPYDAVQYIRFQTEHGEIGRWTFYDVQVKSTVGLQPIPQDNHIYSYHTSGPSQPIYPFAPLSAEKFEFTFDVQAEGNAFVSLSPLPIDQKSYTFVFDQSSNGQISSVVQYDGKVIDKEQGSLISSNVFTTMYIRRQDSVLLAGKVGEDPILEIQGVVEPPPRYINFGNLNEEPTQWRFYNVSPAARGEVSIYLQTLKTPVYDLQIPRGDFMFLFSAMVTDVTYLYFSSEPELKLDAGYKFTFINSDSVGSSRVDVLYNGVAIASYSGNRLNLGDRAYLYVKLVDSTLCFGISGEETPLLHLFDVERDNLKFIGLQRATTGIDLWTFFGLKYIGEQGRDDRVMITEKPSSTPEREPEPPAITHKETEPANPMITRPPPSGGSNTTGSGVISSVDGQTLPGVALPRYDTPVEMAGDTLTLTTNGISGYINKMGPLDLTTGSRGQFSVKAEKNVALALISHNGSDTDYYEILIGTDDNLKTELKRCIETVCYTVLSEDTPYVLKSIKKTLFFIEIIPSADGLLKIQLGKGDVLDIESIMLLSYEDSNPLKVEYIGIRSYEVSADWTFHRKVLLPEDLTSFQTAAGESFYYHPLAHHQTSLSIGAKPEGVSRFEFAVTSPSEVIVSISANRGAQPDRYEIRIGIDKNKKLSLHQCVATNCTLLETALEYEVLILRHLTSFFLELSTTNNGALFVRLGKVGGVDLMDRKLLLYTILRPLQVSYVGFRTPNSAGSWVINQFIRYDSATSKFATKASESYVYQLGPFPAAEEARIDFSIQAPCPAEVVFTSKTTSASDNYTIAIGTDNNQETTITKCVSHECTQLHVIQTPDVLSTVFPAYFYIDIVCKDGTLSARLGKASLAGNLRSDGSTLLVFEDSDPIHATYAGFRTTRCLGVWTTSKQVVTKPATTTESIVEPTSPLPQENPLTDQLNQPDAASTLNEEPSDKVTFTTSGAEEVPLRYEVGPLDPARPARFEFLVQAASDTVIALSPTVDSAFPSYKLHIGARANRETHVMRCLSQYYCPAKLTVQTDAILTSSEPVKFFVELVRSSRTNKLMIRLGLITGTAGVDSVILDYEDVNPLNIGWAGFGTLEDSTGEWTVYRFIFYSGTTLISSFKTGYSHSNIWYPRSYTVSRDQSEMKFMFSVAAEQNALIALSNQASNLDATGVVQIRLGVNENEKSTLSRNGAEIVTADAGHISRNQDATFWVSVDGSIIEVGTEDSDPFMVANLESPINAKYIMFMSGEDGRVTYTWKFYKYFYYSSATGHLESTHDIDVFHAHIYEQTTLEEKFEYSFHPLHENYFGKYTKFSVQAEGSISIALSSDGSLQVEMYEVVFGGEGNADLSLRRCSSCEALVSTHKDGGFLMSSEERSFMISVYDGTIRVYDEQVNEPLLEWTDPEPLPVSFAGFSLKSSSHFTYSSVPTGSSYTDEAPSPYFYAVQLVTEKPWKIILSTSAQQSGEVYEIVYGAVTNARSEIRKGNIPVAFAQNAGLVSSTEPNYYWFKLADNVIQTGLFDPVSSQRCAPFLQYRDPDFISVPLFRISTGDAEAVFNFGFGSGLDLQLEANNQVCQPYADAAIKYITVEKESNEVDEDRISDEEASGSKEKRSSDERRSEEKKSSDERRNEEKKSSDERRSEEKKSSDERRSEEKKSSDEIKSSEEKRSSDEIRSSEEKRKSEEKRHSEEKSSSEEKDGKKNAKGKKKKKE